MNALRGYESGMQDAVESILGNARLTADLDDEAADILINWGISCVRKIYLEAAESHDFEEITYTRMRATRKVMRAINNFVAQASDTDSEKAQSVVDNVITLVSEAYGGYKTMPTKAQKVDFLESKLSLPQDKLLTHLLSLFDEGGEVTRE
jgi:hypothetical protein